MKHYIKLDERDIQAIIADFYNIPVEKMDEQVEINLSVVTKGCGEEGEHQEPALYVRVFTS